MRNVNAIFYKQFKDTLKNPATLIQFIIYPLIAFVITRFVDFENVMNLEGMFEGMSGEIQALMQAAVLDMQTTTQVNMPNMTTMQATIFAGMGLIFIVAGIISADAETKSLRFLMMAGIKPASYLLGVGGVVFIVSFFTSLAFTLIGGFKGQDFCIFLAVMMSGVTASIVLGATFGILMKNQQAASGVAMPAAVILGFGPMIAQFNDDIARVFHVFYTQQINVVADFLTMGGAETSLWESFGIMWANVAVFSVLFALAYSRKGLAE